MLFHALLVFVEALIVLISALLVFSSACKVTQIKKCVSPFSHATIFNNFNRKLQKQLPAAD